MRNKTRNKKGKKILNDAFIFTTIWKNVGRVIVVRNEKGQLLTWNKAKNVKGGVKGATFNFIRTRKLKTVKEIPYIIEKKVYEGTGLRKIGKYSTTDLKVKKPDAKVVQYSVRAMFSDGSVVYGTSFDVNKFNLSHSDAREQAFTNLFKNISAELGGEYSEQVGRRHVNNSKTVRLNEGWIAYDTKAAKIASI